MEEKGLDAHFVYLFHVCSCKSLESVDVTATAGFGSHHCEIFFL
jgi:hypothetical protein